MDETRPRELRALVMGGRFAILAGLVAGISGVGRVIADGIRTGTWDGPQLLGWAVLGALPYLGGWITGMRVRGPGNEGLRTVALVTIALGVLVAVIWVMAGLARQG